jgi:linearmycin/streptolysin S transport system permease protein
LHLTLLEARQSYNVRSPMSPAVTVAAKDLRVLARRRGDLFFVLAWPVLLAVLLGVIFAAPPEGRAPIEVAVVDEDGTEASRAFAARLGATDGLSVTPASREEASRLVRQGRRAAWVVLEPGFGAALRRAAFGTPPTVEIGVDPSRAAETAMLEGLLVREAAAALQERLRVGFQPLAVRRKGVVAEAQGPRRSFDFTFPQGILWGMLACAATFAVSIVSERTTGTMARLLTAPLSRRQLLAGKALACFAAILAMEVLVLLVGVAAFGVRPASWLLLAAAGVSSAIAFVGIMLVLATLGRTESSANAAAWATLLVMALVGGGMVPLFVMPRFMATASHLSPAKWVILAFEGALWRGFSPAEMALPCAILLAIGALGFALGSRLARTA